MIIFHLFYLLRKSLYTNGLRRPGRRNLLATNDLGVNYLDMMISLSPVLCLCCLCSLLAICIALAEFLALSISLPNIVIFSHLVKFLFNVIIIIYTI